MKLFVCILFCVAPFAIQANDHSQGFKLDESLKEVTIRYTKYKNLIVISPKINDTLQVNLILDTGCINVVLFGKKYLKYFNNYLPRPVVFSGLGEDEPVKGNLSIQNTFEFSGIIGNGISVVIVPKRSVLTNHATIDGIIGYDLLSKFEIEVDPVNSLLTFRPASLSNPKDDLAILRMSSTIPSPVLMATINSDTNNALSLLIDTGSELGLVYKSSDFSDHDDILGRGISGLVYGERGYCKKLVLDDKLISVDLEMSTIAVKGNDSLSLGMDFLGKQLFIINLVKGYLQLGTIPAEIRLDQIIEVLSSATY